MTADELMGALLERDATLTVEDGRLRYQGPALADTDPIRTAIREHREELVALFTLHAPVEHPAGWSDRLQREVLESEPTPAGQWQETPASAALCIWCSSPLADGDLLRCVQHVAEHGVATPCADGWAMRRRDGIKERAA